MSVAVVALSAGKTCICSGAIALSFSRKLNSAKVTRTARAKTGTCIDAKKREYPVTTDTAKSRAASGAGKDGVGIERNARKSAGRGDHPREVWKERWEGGGVGREGW